MLRMCAVLISDMYASVVHQMAYMYLYVKQTAVVCVVATREGTGRAVQSERRMGSNMCDY